MSGSVSPLPWRHMFQTLRHYMPLWAGATIVFALLGCFYTGVRKSTFSAHQVLLVRNPASGEDVRLGKFASQTDLKAAQETILQLARSRDVVRNAISKLGPSDEESIDEKQWPSADAIEQARKLINVTPPKNSEFGATEVIHLEANESTKERAKQLCMYVREALIEAMQNMRAERSNSVILELEQTRELAKDRHTAAYVKLQKMESEVGSDLSELRALTESFAGSGNSQRVLADVQKELQLAELDLNRLRELEKLLQRGMQDPDQLLVAGGELLSSQPTLKRLKDGLIDAQLLASRLSSLYTKDHPKMKAAEASQQEILQKMLAEISASIDSMTPQMRVAQERVDKLVAKQLNLSQRMERLAEMRVTYSNLLADCKQRTELLAKAEESLVDAEAVHNSALNIDLLTPLGDIQVGSEPVGPNDLMLVVGSIVSGLLFGFGAVFLVAPGPVQQSFGRRWSDYSGANLQPSDQSPSAGTDQQGNEAADAWVNLQVMTGKLSPEEAREQSERRRNAR